MTQEKKQEYTRRITQANKTQMITIIYEMIISYLSDARDDLSLSRTAEAIRNLSYAQSCIDELIRSVNRRVELGRMLHQIYIFSKKELIAAGATKSIHRVWKVEQNFKTLHEAYKEIEKEDTSEPTMGNIQMVYTGLTYGKHSLNDSVTCGLPNRGYTA